MLGLLCRGGWMKACIAPGNPSCGCGSHAERAQVDGFDTPLEPSVRATNVGVLGPSRACHCCDDRSGAAVASQGEGRAATADGRGRPCTGQDHGSSVVSLEGFSASGLQASPAGVGALRADALPSRPRPGSGGRPASSMLCACARRNSDQLGPIRRGAGPRRETRNRVAIVVAETLIPSFSSSPRMRI